MPMKNPDIKGETKKMLMSQKNDFELKVIMIQSLPNEMKKSVKMLS